MTVTVIELDTRVSVLETETKNVKEDINDMQMHMNKIYDVVFDVKERIDKQNGKLPYIVEKVDSLSDKQEIFIGKFNDYLLDSEKKNISNKLKTKIMQSPEYEIARNGGGGGSSSDFDNNDIPF